MDLDATFSYMEEPEFEDLQSKKVVEEEDMWMKIDVEEDDIGMENDVGASKDVGSEEIRSKDDGNADHVMEPVKKRKNHVRGKTTMKGLGIEYDDAKRVAFNSKDQPIGSGQSLRNIHPDVKLLYLTGQDQPSLFDWTRSTFIARTLSHRVLESQLDVNKDLNRNLKTIYEEFIMLVTKLVKDPMLSFTTKEKIPRTVLNCGSSLHRVGDSSPSQRLGTPNSGTASNFNMAGHRDISLRSGSPRSSRPSSRPGVQVPNKNQACKLLSWYNEGEVVSDGRIHETDPKRSIHGMPIVLFSEEDAESFSVPDL